MVAILPMFRVNSHGHPFLGSHTATQDGVYEIIWDNSYSRYTPSHTITHTPSHHHTHTMHSIAYTHTHTVVLYTHIFIVVLFLLCVSAAAGFSPRSCTTTLQRNPVNQMSITSSSDSITPPLSLPPFLSCPSLPLSLFQSTL